MVNFTWRERSHTFSTHELGVINELDGAINLFDIRFHYIIVNVTKELTRFECKLSLLLLYYYGT